MKHAEHTTPESLAPTLRLIGSWVTSLHLLHQRLTPLIGQWSRFRHTHQY